VFTGRFGHPPVEVLFDMICRENDGNELGLALAQMADVLSEDEQPLAASERADVLTLAGRMQMNDRVPRALP
jgi:hypothetical protein